MASTDGWLKTQLQGLRSHAGSPGANIQLAQMTPEQEAWAKKYDPNAMKGRPAPKPAAPAPAPSDPNDPLNLKKTTEERMKSTSLADSPIMVAAAQDPAMNSREGRYIQSATQNPNSLGAPSALPPQNSNFGPNHPWNTGVPVPGSPAGPGLPPSIPAPRSGLELEEVQTAARGGSFDEGDEVLVGEEGPELVQLGGPAEVTPLDEVAGGAGLAAAAGATRRRGKPPALTETKKSLREGVKIGKEGLNWATQQVKHGWGATRDWARGAAADPRAAAREAGRGTAQGVTAAEAAAKAVPDIARAGAEGYREVRPKPHIAAADYAEAQRATAPRPFTSPQMSPEAQAERARLNASRRSVSGAFNPAMAGGTPPPPPRGPFAPNLGAAGEASGHGAIEGGRVPPPEAPPKSLWQRGLRAGAGYGSGALAAVAEGFDPNVRAALDPTSDVSTTDRLRQGARSALRTGGAILGGAGGFASPVPGGMLMGGAGGYYLGEKAADFLVGPAGPTGVVPTQKGAAATQSGSVGTDDSEQARRGAALEVGKLQAAREALVQGASPEAGGTGISVGGLRGTPVTPTAGAGGINPGIRVMGEIGSFGAASRLAKNAAELSLARQELGVKAATAAATLSQRDRALAAGEEDRSSRAFNQVLGDRATELAGPMLEGEKPDAYNTRVERELSTLRGDVNYTLGDSTGKRFGQLDMGEQQQILLADRFKRLNTAARSGFLQSIRDYPGNSRVDTRNLYTYMPVKAVRADLPGGGGWVLHLKNGNKAAVSDLGGGNFRWLGPNTPVDGDTMAMILPLIQKAEQGKR